MKSLFGSKRSTSSDSSTSLTPEEPELFRCFRWRDDLATAKGIAVKQFLVPVRENDLAVARLLDYDDTHLEKIINIRMNEPLLMDSDDNVHVPTLADFLSVSTCISHDFFWSVVQQFCHALSTLHNRGLVHGYVNPFNCSMYNVLSGQPYITLTNFGLDVPCNQLPVSWAIYTSPQVLRRKKKFSWNPSDDAYGLACIMYELLMRDKPFSGTSTDILYLQKKKGVKISDRMLEDNHLARSSSHHFSNFSYFITKCLNGSKRAREPISYLQTVLDNPEKAQVMIATTGPINLDFSSLVGWHNSEGEVHGVCTSFQYEICRNPAGEPYLDFISDPSQLMAFGSLMQSISAYPLRKWDVRVSAEMEWSVEEESFVGIWMRGDGRGRKQQFFDNMAGQYTGKSDGFQLVTNTLRKPVPPKTNIFHFGILLVGQGKLKVKNMKIEVCDVATGNWCTFPSVFDWQLPRAKLWQLTLGWISGATYSVLPRDVLIMLFDFVYLLILESFKVSKCDSESLTTLCKHRLLL